MPRSCSPGHGQFAEPPKAFDSPIVYFVISQWDSEGPSNSRHLSIAFADPTELSQISTTRLLKIFSSKAAGSSDAEAYCSCTSRRTDDRERSWREFSATGLEFADGALQDGHLGHGVAGGLELCADLFFEVGGVADFVDEEVEETFGGQQALRLQFVEGLVAHRYIAAADVENDVVVAIPPEPFEP